MYLELEALIIIFYRTTLRFVQGAARAQERIFFNFPHVHTTVYIFLIELLKLSRRINSHQKLPTRSKLYDHLDVLLNLTQGKLGRTGALCEAPFVKNELFFFCIFSRYLCNGDSSVDPTRILPCREQELFIAQSIFRENL